MKKIAFYGFVTIGIYLAVAYSTGAGRVLTAGSSGLGSLIRDFQGRS